MALVEGSGSKSAKNTVQFGSHTKMFEVNTIVPCPFDFKPTMKSLTPLQESTHTTTW